MPYLRTAWDNLIEAMNANRNAHHVKDNWLSGVLSENHWRKGTKVRHMLGPNGYDTGTHLSSHTLNLGEIKSLGDAGAKSSLLLIDWLYWQVEATCPDSEITMKNDYNPRLLPVAHLFICSSEEENEGYGTC